MISIIICSRTKTITSDLTENIENTVGCNYELVVIDNSQNGYSIFEAYNLGIERSRGDYLCFVHDDVLFHTIGWGKVVESIFQSDDRIGLLGVAGAKVKTKMPSGWWNCPENQKEINILQHTNGQIESWYYGFNSSELSPVATIDGVFMVLRKSNGLKFNENIKGYHNYDLNISLENFAIGKITVVTNQILIEHFSNGNINKSWYESTFKIHNLYHKVLPVSIGEGFEIRELELQNGFKFLKSLLDNTSRISFLKLWICLLLKEPRDRKHVVIFKRFLKTILSYH